MLNFRENLAGVCMQLAILLNKIHFNFKYNSWCIDVLLKLHHYSLRSSYSNENLNKSFRGTESFFSFLFVVFFCRCFYFVFKIFGLVCVCFITITIYPFLDVFPFFFFWKYAKREKGNVESERKVGVKVGGRRWWHTSCGVRARAVPLPRVAAARWNARCRRSSGWGPSRPSHSAHLTSNWHRP